MGVLRTVAKRVLSSGTAVLPDVVIPAGATTIQLKTDVTNWPTVPAGIEATITLALSSDNGNTWEPAMAISYTGGLNPRTGLPAPGPAPTYTLSEPLPRSVLARWTVSLARPYDLGATLEST